MKSNIAKTVLGGQKKMPTTKSAIKPNMMPNLEEDAECTPTDVARGRSARVFGAHDVLGAWVARSAQLALLEEPLRAGTTVRACAHAARAVWCAPTPAHASAARRACVLVGASVGAGRSNEGRRVCDFAASAAF